MHLVQVQVQVQVQVHLVHLAQVGQRWGPFFASNVTMEIKISSQKYPGLAGDVRAGFFPDHIIQLLSAGNELARVPNPSNSGIVIKTQILFLEPDLTDPDLNFDSFLGRMLNVRNGLDHLHQLVKRVVFQF